MLRPDFLRLLHSFGDIIISTGQRLHNVFPYFDEMSFLTFLFAASSQNYSQLFATFTIAWSVWLGQSRDACLCWKTRLCPLCAKLWSATAYVSPFCTLVFQFKWDFKAGCHKKVLPRSDSGIGSDKLNFRCENEFFSLWACFCLKQNAILNCFLIPDNETAVEILVYLSQRHEAVLWEHNPSEMAAVVQDLAAKTHTSQVKESLEKLLII